MLLWTTLWVGAWIEMCRLMFLHASRSDVFSSFYYNGASVAASRSDVFSGIYCPGSSLLSCFVHILQAFGQSFLQPDIHIFKQNVCYLEALNSKHKLYHRVSFLPDLHNSKHHNQLTYRIIWQLQKSAKY